MLILPAIDLKNGRCVRLYQGQADQETVFFDKPVDAAMLWKNQGAEYLHIVDLDGAFTGQPQHLDIVKDIARQTGLPVQIGGGIRSRETVEDYLNAGVDRVIIGTRALESPDWLAELCAAFPGRVAAGVDARDGMVAVKGWTEVSKINLAQIADILSPMPLRAVIYTDISKDGALQGPSIESTRQFTERVNLPVIISGGVTRLADLAAIAQMAATLKHGRIEGAIIGRALYAGTISLPDALGVTRS